MNPSVVNVTRPYQIVVWGATGFTGKLVCEHLAKNYQSKVRWALAGRDKAKLSKVRADLVKINPDCENVPILTADALDPSSVGELAGQTSVLLSTVGPFAKVGDVVADQCVAHRTHYCDITGELTWVRKSVMKRSALATANDVSIVHCCGYDSVPSDLGTFFLARHAREKYGKGITHAANAVGPLSGGVSGGTVASVALLLESKQGLDEMRAARNALNYLGEGTDAKPSSPSSSTLSPVMTQPQMIPAWNPLTKSYLAPFFMEPVNSKVVYFSNSLLSTPYSTDREVFRYVEGLASRSGFDAAIKGMGFLAAGAALVITPLRKMLLGAGLLPSPGGGPTEEQRTKGFWRHYVYALVEGDPESKSRKLIKGICGDDRDPGYWSTSRMLLETALCLATTTPDEREAVGCRRGGVLTPAAATGPLLIDRLKKSGFTFQITGEEDYFS